MAEQWRGWQEIPGNGKTTDAMSVISPFPEEGLAFFHKGTDGRIYNTWFNGTIFGKWAELPGGLSASCPPSAGSSTRGLQVFAIQEQDGLIYRNSFGGPSGWTGWQPVPFPQNLSLPQVNPVWCGISGIMDETGIGIDFEEAAQTRLWLFLAFEYQLSLHGTPFESTYFNIRDDQTADWVDWQPMPLPSAEITSQRNPTAIARLRQNQEGKFVATVIQANTTLHRLQYSIFTSDELLGRTGSWSGWTDVPGDLPVDLAPALSRDLLFAVGHDHSIYVNKIRWDKDGVPTAWSGWSQVPGGFQTNHSPSATRFVFNTSNRLYMTAVGLNQAMYYNILSSDGFNPPPNPFGPPVPPTPPNPSPPPKVAQLVATNSSYSPTVVHENEPFTVTFYFCNYGNAPTGAFTLRIELDGGVDYTDIRISSLAPDACNSAFWNISGLTGTDHYFHVYLDIYNEVVENSRQGSIGYLGVILEP